MCALLALAGHHQLALHQCWSRLWVGAMGGVWLRLLARVLIFPLLLGAREEVLVILKPVASLGRDMQAFVVEERLGDLLQ